MMVQQKYLLKKFKILGLMFHPERKNISQPNINKLVYKFFKLNENCNISSW